MVTGRKSFIGPPGVCYVIDRPPALSCHLGKEACGTHPGSASRASVVRLFWFLLFSASFVLCMQPCKRFPGLVLRELISLAFLVCCF